MKNTLVSVGIITYNSEKTILETLNSAYNQTYKNIELIISDDFSQDNTVNICKEWISEHSSRFVNCFVVTSTQNTGTSANCNRLINYCSGEYLKILAGDDIFTSTCIEDNIKNIGTSDMQISDLIRFNSSSLLPYKNPINFNKFCKLPISKRVHYYARTGFFCNIPTIFLRKSIFDLVGKYDEKSKIFEDVPFLLKVFSSNAKISYFSKITVKYREGGISNSNSVKFDKELLKIFFKYRIKFLHNDSILDRIVILERRLYNLLLDKKESKTLLLKIYCHIYTKYLKLINRIY